MSLFQKSIFGASIIFVLFAGSTLSSFEEISSPKKQIDLGVLPEDVVCRGELQLVIRNNGNPACVKDTSLFKLLQIGWAAKVISLDNKDPQDTVRSDQAQNTSPSLAPPLVQSPSISDSFDASPTTESSSPSISLDSIGYAVGGAQDINNFRENIKHEFLPLYTDISYEGLFYDYYFDTGKSKECEKLFCPSYSYAISKDPFSKKDDYYLSVGLDSGMTESDFERKKLNLVIVLDISGSMSSQFNTYHYDNPTYTPTSDDMKTKMQLATESVAGLVDHLNDDDKLGVVLFDDSANILTPLESMKFTDKERLKENILKIYPNGGTHMESGMSLGTALYDELKDIDSTKYENRIIFLTDAMPNLGNTSDSGLLKMIADNAEQKIYTTFIGIGLDFNTELVNELTKARGSNYYSVHSASEFKNKMIDEFEFMVTPLVFNLLLSLDADGYEIKKVYGSPEADESTGQIMKVNTLFPSKTKEGQTKGGIILLKLEKISDDGTITLKTSYEDRTGQLDGDETIISFDKQESDYYENSGIHKGVLLSRYAELMKTWIFDERRSLYENTPVERPVFFYDEGIHIPSYVEMINLGQWERQSTPLTVSDRYEETIAEFSRYFYNELDIIGDDTLDQELEILNKLENY